MQNKTLIITTLVISVTTIVIVTAMLIVLKTNEPESFAFDELGKSWSVSKDVIGLDSDEGSVLGATYTLENESKNLKVTFENSLYTLTEEEVKDAVQILERYIEKEDISGERFVISKFDDFQIVFKNAQTNNYYVIRFK